MNTYTIGNNNKIVVNNGTFQEKYIKNIKFSSDSSNNTLFLESLSQISNSDIKFLGNNSTVHICNSKRNYNINIRIFENSLFYIGENCFF